VGKEGGKCVNWLKTAYQEALLLAIATDKSARATEIGQITKPPLILDPIKM